MDSKTGHTLMTMLAKLMPEEELLDKLQEAITEYKAVQTKETKKGVQFYIMLVATNIFTTDKSTEEVMEDMERSHKAIDLLDDKTKTTS